MPPTPEAIAAAPTIRQEALRAINDSTRPLPSLAVWQAREPHGWNAAYQYDLLQSGYHILPSIRWPDQYTPSNFESQCSGLIGLCNELNLPFCLVGTQWPQVLLDSGVYGTGIDTYPGLINTDNVAVARLDPMGPTGAWVDPATTYIGGVTNFTTLQSWYPNPPLVILLSNNEPTDLNWTQAETSKRYVDTYGYGQSDDFKITIVSSGWIERYNIMFEAMRNALTTEWSNVTKFVGYTAFGPPFIGRWNNPTTWQQYSLCPMNLETGITPDWHMWDGGSPEYYTHNWNDTSDYTTFSTQIESCNFQFMLDEALEVNPNFWFELSTWDGNLQWYDGQDCSTFFDNVGGTLYKPKACQYRLLGQEWGEDRYEGWMQFALWLLRPKVLREFRFNTQERTRWTTYFDRFIDIIERVHNNSTLKAFWQHGTLLSNPSQGHPYNKSFPPRYYNKERWFLLDVNVNPSPITFVRDGTKEYTDKYVTVPVFAIAYLLGSAPSRRWLVYAHSPLEYRDVTITIPSYGDVQLTAAPEGTFLLLSEPFLPISSLNTGTVYRLEFTFDIDYYLIIEHEATRTKVWKCSNSQPYYIDHSTLLLSASPISSLSVAFQPFTEDRLQLMYDVQNQLKHSGAKVLHSRSFGSIIAVDERKISSDKGSTFYLDGRAATDSAVEIARQRRPN